MAEIGLVQFAQVALPVAETILPRYRSKFSKHQFTQPQLLVILCLMRYEDWTFRETEVRLSEHSDLRQALQLEQAPDYTTLYRFMRRLDEPLLEQLLQETVRQMPASPQERLTIAVDATGLTPGAVSTYFIHRQRDQPPGFTWRHWVKWVVAVDVVRQLLLAQIAKQGPTNDSATLRPLVDRARQVQALDVVLADAEFVQSLRLPQPSACAGTRCPEHHPGPAGQAHVEDPRHPRTDAAALSAQALSATCPD